MHKNIKYLVVLWLIASVFSHVFAQDTTFYDTKWKRVNKATKADYFVVVETTDKVSNDYVAGPPVIPDKKTERTFDKDKHLLIERHYSSYLNNILDGETKRWYPDGMVKAIIHYKNDTLNGLVTTYWHNGKLRRQDFFGSHGKLQSGYCYDSLGDVVPHYDFLKRPVFTYYKGDENYYFASHIRYPRRASYHGVGGKAVLSWIVEKDGSMSNVEVIKSSDDRDLDDAAIDVFTGADMPLWKPGTEDGEPVRVRYTFWAKFDPGW